MGDTSEPQNDRSFTADNSPIQIYPVPAFSDNYIWVLVNPALQQAVVIDPGDAEPVLAFLHQHQLDLIGIWITHQHYDHIGGVPALQATYPMTHVVAHKDHGVAANQTVHEGSRLHAWGHTVLVWEVAGHTAHHLAYLLDIEGREHVFCGDTLFSGGCGRVFTGTIEALHASIQRLMTLAEDTLFYPAHEYTQSNLRFGQYIEPSNADITSTLAQLAQPEGIPSLPVTLAHERLVNVFMRTQVPTVISGVQAAVKSAIAQHQEIDPLPDTSSLSVFRALRTLKNQY